MTYAEFAKKYDNFMVPSMEISIGEKKLSELGCVTAGVEVSLSMEEASTASFQIGDCYDLEEGKLKSAIKSNIQLGEKIEVRIGYASKKTLVFKGYIDSLGLSYSAESGFVYDVSAADVVKLLKEGGKRVKTHTKDDYSKIFQDVMSPYSSLVSVEAQTRTDELKVAIMQECSDYEFITKDLIEEGAADFSFHVMAGKAYFKRTDEKKEIAAQFGPGEGLKGCRFSFGYVNREIAVYGYSRDMKKYMGSAQAAAEDLAQGAVKGTEIVTLRAESENEAKKKAEKYAQDLEKKSKSGSLTVVGLPELLPGAYIKISRVDSRISGDYQITAVKHSLGNDGFTSDLSIGG